MRMRRWEESRLDLARKASTRRSFGPLFGHVAVERSHRVGCHSIALLLLHKKTNERTKERKKRTLAIDFRLVVVAPSTCTHTHGAMISGDSLSLSHSGVTIGYSRRKGAWKSLFFFFFFSLSISVCIGRKGEGKGGGEGGEWLKSIRMHRDRRIVEDLSIDSNDVNTHTQTHTERENRPLIKRASIIRVSFSNMCRQTGISESFVI